MSTEDCDLPYLTVATVGRLRAAGGYTAQHRSLYTCRWVAR